MDECIRLVFAKWSALKIAIEQNPWPRTDNPFDELAHHTLEYFKSSQANIPELVANFELYFDEQLDVQVMDGSFEQVASQLMSLYQSVEVEKNMEPLESLRESIKHLPSSYCTIVDQDSTDEDSDANNDENMDENAMSVDEPTKEEPEVDQDGFTMVTKSNRRHR